VSPHRTFIFDKKANVAYNALCMKLSSCSFNFPFYILDWVQKIKKFKEWSVLPMFACCSFLLITSLNRSFTVLFEFGSYIASCASFCRLDPIFSIVAYSMSMPQVQRFCKMQGCHMQTSLAHEWVVFNQMKSKFIRPYTLCSEGRDKDGECLLIFVQTSSFPIIYGEPIELTNPCA